MLASPLLLLVTVSHAAALPELPPNTWVEVKYTTVQPAEKGLFLSQGWNKLVYDPDDKRVLFYDRWLDKTHGGGTIYGNCLFAFDPATARLTPVKIDNWTKTDTKTGGYRTLALPENDTEPTPCPRHVYHAFDYLPGRKAVFICNGANQTVIDKNGELVGHDECDGAWQLDLATNKWAPVKSNKGPPNRLDDAMAYCPETDSIIYAGHACQLWILDLKKSAWRKAKQSPPSRNSHGQTIFHDPVRKRMLIAGGGQLDAWTKGKAPAFRELYAFDPVEESVRRLADCPTALYEAHLAHDRKRDQFFTVAVFNKREQPSGMFRYDPKADSWHEITPANAIPPHSSWFGWMNLCYDAHNDCLVGRIRERFYVYRFEPAK